jgi:ATP-binding cassette subfamily F protein uup
MAQINLRDLTYSNLSLPLVENANLFIEPGERVALIGRNGAGKTTLLRLITGEILPDSGTIELAKSAKTALLPQAVPQSIPGTVYEVIEQQLTKNTDENWQDTTPVARIISKLDLPGDSLFNDLSGGLKRLVLLASIFINEPDILLLDEPTNHLDLDKITLLEKLLGSYQKTIIFITHDRTLLQKLATHIVEIDNGQLHSWRGDYNHYLQHKENLLAAEAKANALFDKRLAEEEQWIRQGIKARRTRNEGRVRALKKMREERQQRRTRQGQIKFSQTLGSTSGKIVFAVEQLSFAYGNKSIIKNFSTVIQRSDKIGIIGPNGAGKSTLVNLLLGNITPTEGQIYHGTKLNVGYFDQYRLQLDENKSIFEELTEVGDTITLGNQQKHVMSYLQDFLFSPTQALTPIKNLSGGERNRVMLAKLFSKPCNVLVLDEPTNDLDIETLELLEEMLVEYQGTLLLISHDRSFLNNVATGTLVFEEDGKIEEYVGGYDDWLRQKKPQENILQEAAEKSKKIASKESGKLSFKEQKELAALPDKIEKLESRQNEINKKLADPQIFKDDPTIAIDFTKELSEIENLLDDCYSRWELLENKTKS